MTGMPTAFATRPCRRFSAMPTSCPVLSLGVTTLRGGPSSLSLPVLGALFSPRCVPSHLDKPCIAQRLSGYQSGGPGGQRVPPYSTVYGWGCVPRHPFPRQRCRSAGALADACKWHHGGTGLEEIHLRPRKTTHLCPPTRPKIRRDCEQ